MRAASEGLCKCTLGEPEMFATLYETFKEKEGCCDTEHGEGIAQEDTICGGKI